ncbi:hypothetical protein [Methanosphaerula palustris]|uniref:Uncharacterized protein n=1 Tax=Methanosphaerula palustris (strain ATCC BAA-1556 / DSM 19958 / E1-9c) TaxID=521011 RepID=B8GJU3_METPE|nr:hypothetical protein [Methanosphaerula palustris]ACL15747.1 conserved hypothetical protein [Methanosphaerula palustris E1-9c]
MNTGSEIRRGLEVLVAPGQVFEVRSWTGDRIASGYFDDLDTAGKAIEALDAANPDGIYLTPNPVLPDLLARRANRIKGPLAKKDSSTSDGDILSRRWFLIDIDPARPSGVSSSDEEHQAALDRATEIAAALGERGWPAPVAGDSGNGAHLLYRVDLPNDEQVTALIRAALVGLDGLFSDARASVDTAVFNASRIWKVYGTVARKGDNTRSRPHRRSRLLSMPDPIAIVTREQLAALAITDPGGDTAAPAPSNRGTSRQVGEKIDLAGWLRDHDLGVIDRRPYRGGDLYRLDACPFSSAHTDGAFAIQFASGAIHAGCHHASCGGGSQRWPELREMYEKPKVSAITPEEKGAAYRKKKATAREAVAGRDDAAPVETDAADEAVLAEARQILETGDPLAYMVDTFNLEHVGDRDLAHCLALSLASRLVATSEGLHVMTTGESGKGKSDGYRVMLRQLPDAWKIKGSFSDKSLYYMGESLKPQTVFLIDDKDLSDSLQEVLKEATTDFRKPIEHRTVTTDRKPQICYIPERCIWWIARVEGVGDDQVKNRMLMPWVDDSDEQDRAVLAGILERLARDEDEPIGELHEIAVCKALWTILQSVGLVDVNLSRFALRIHFSSARNRRNSRMLTDMIQSAAMLRYFQRDRRDLQDGITRIYATEDDFRTAAAIFTALHTVSGSQDAKLTRREDDVLRLLAATGETEFTVQKIMNLTKLSYDSVRRMLVGYGDRGIHRPGLLEKCPAIAKMDTSVSIRDEDDDRTVRTIHRRETTFSFDLQVYRRWQTGGQVVWLDEPGDRDRDPDPRSNTCQQHQQHIRSINAVSTATIKTDNPALSAETDDKSLCVQREGSLNAAEMKSTHPAPSPEGRVCAGVCVPEKNCDLTSNTGIRNLIQKQGRQSPPKVSSKNCKDAATTCKDCGDAAVTSMAGGEPARPAPPLTLAQVNPGDYSLIPGGPLIEPCPVCGGRVVHYTERYQARKARGPKEKSRNICRGCYNRARACEQAAIQVLPGVIPLDEVESVDAGLFGRCSVCGLQAATYNHAGSGTGICSVCYEKLVREQVDIR